MKAYKAKSYAKLNLYLEVLKKRKDQYHEITTLFERIGLADEVSVRLRRDSKIRIICAHNAVPKGRSNLAYKAALLLRLGSGMERGADITINKHVPVAAGLGGGSSNAASALLLLNRAWKLNLSRKKLIDYGRMIGADVPFFLANASFAVGSGRGDRIAAVPALKKKFWHLLLVPRIKISTKTVYCHLDRLFKADFQALPALSRPEKSEKAGLTNCQSDVKILIQTLRQGNIPLIKKCLFNRLQIAAFSLHPGLKKLRQGLIDAGSEEIFMSGSGPAMFGIFSSKKEASSISRQVSRLGKWDSFIVKTA